MSDSGSSRDLRGSAVRHQLAAVPAGAGAKVDDVVGAADGFFVVLHHQHGVAQIAQLFERLQQAAVVAMMQPDGRLVQHVEHAAQLGSDLRGQPDALAFAAGERGRRAVQRDVAQPDVRSEIAAAPRSRARCAPAIRPRAR